MYSLAQKNKRGRFEHETIKKRKSLNFAYYLLSYSSINVFQINIGIKELYLWSISGFSPRMQTTYIHSP